MAVSTASREQQPCITDGVPRLQMHLLGSRVHACSPRRHELNLMRFVPVGRCDHPARQVLLSTQVTLGQRWSSKREAGLLPEDQQFIGVTLFPQFLGRGTSSQTRADDHYRTPYPL